MLLDHAGEHVTDDLHWILHFTRVEHLPLIVEHGLLADARAAAHLKVEIGNRGIKAQRSRRAVPVPPGGVVADYVPFYYAPRSPMMFAIHHGNVPTYSEGCDRLVYLVTSLERLWRAGLRPVGTDRNAVLDIAAFSSDPRSVLDAVDWPLMRERYWSSTPEDPDRRERRQAECLVHREVSWALIDYVYARSAPVAEEVERVLASIGDDDTQVFVRPSMYF